MSHDINRAPFAWIAKETAFCNNAAAIKIYRRISSKQALLNTRLPKDPYLLWSSNQTAFKDTTHGSGTESALSNMQEFLDHGVHDKLGISI